MKRFFKLTIAVTATLLAGFVANGANAGTVTGHIASLFISAPSNLPFRINLDVPVSDCPSGILYVDSANGNYQVYVSALMLAYSQSKRVSITYTSGIAGFCSISEFSVF